jgi:hypothetical protein
MEKIRNGLQKNTGSKKIFSEMPFFLQKKAKKIFSRKLPCFYKQITPLITLQSRRTPYNYNNLSTEKF